MDADSTPRQSAQHYEETGWILPARDCLFVSGWEDASVRFRHRCFRGSRHDGVCYPCANCWRSLVQHRKSSPSSRVLIRGAAMSSMFELGEGPDHVMALSKMNWNTFVFSTPLPATVHSSNEIATIGKLLKRCERESYDYRLFI